MSEWKALDRLAEDFPAVTSVFKTHWETPLKEYAAELYHHPATSLEPELKEAFAMEWGVMGLDQKTIDDCLEKLEKNPVLQTSHHVTPTNGPTFLAIDIISQLGLKESDIYLVAASSGVAFSNTAWSGAISYGEIPLEQLVKKDTPLYLKEWKAAQDRQRDGTGDNRISLISAKMRDQLLYGSNISEGMVEIYSQFSDELKALLVEPQEGQSYSVWACLNCSRLQQRVIGHSPEFYFDSNRVIANYLIAILRNPSDHFIKDMLFKAGLSDRVNELFDHPGLFLKRYKGKKSSKIEELGWKNGGTDGSRSGWTEYQPETLADALRDEEICPGVFLQFLVFRFINGLKCLGSFHQTEYLERYRKQWLEGEFGRELKLDPDPFPALTTGRLLTNEREVWPLDLAWHRAKVPLEYLPSQAMSHLWEPIVQQLAEG